MALHGATDHARHVSERISGWSPEIHAAEIRNVTEDPDPERFKLYRLCDCPTCEGKGKVDTGLVMPLVNVVERCPECRGEGRVRELVATCASPEAVGVALVTLGREQEWAECPFGLLDTEGETGQKWLIRPWLPSARNVSDAGRTLAKAPRKKATSSE